MWNFQRFAPESSRSLSLLSAVAVLCGATACGPSNDAGTPTTYNIVFTLSVAPVSQTLLEFTVTYTGGDFSGSGSTVSCFLSDTQNDATFNDDNAGELTVSIDASLSSLDDNAAIVECDFFASVQPSPDNFEIEITASEPSDEDDLVVVVSSTELLGGE